MRRNFAVRESMNLQLTGDMFNAFNRTNYAPPDQSNVFTQSLGVNTTLGQINRTISTSRQFQVGLHFQF
jgi:hypothetical protein